MVGSFTGEQAIKYIPISEDDSLVFSNISKSQKINENFRLKRGFVEFKNEGAAEIEKIEVYRTTEINSNVPNYEFLYRSFEDKR